uniref:Uncharacterized protein n=1 Tax=Anguilla anguilla TaxID=7936 RepID=A0A0E9V112_ANGAN
MKTLASESGDSAVNINTIHLQLSYSITDD